MRTIKIRPMRFSLLMTKNFVLLQPQDIFVKQPDVLFNDESQLEPTVENPESGADISNKPKSGSKQVPFARDHQFLAYLDLMETTKPFLVNTIRIPALQCLLLFASRIDTNWDATKITFDKWIQVTLLDEEAGKKALACTIWIRNNLNKLMGMTLKNVQSGKAIDSGLDDGLLEQSIPGKKNQEKMKHKNEVRALKRILHYCLAAFLAGNIGGPYMFTKLHSSDTKTLYRTMATKQPTNNQLQIDKERGGYEITDFLTINNLFVNSVSREQMFLNDIAAEEISIRLRQQLNRKFMPTVVIGNEKEDAPVDDKNTIVCPKCSARVKDTMVDKLRHKNQCSQ